MSDFSVRSDAVDVELIMKQIRARIREKRGVDYTEDEIRELANVKLEKFLDPSGLRSDLVEQFRRARKPSPPLPNFAFEDTTLFESHRGFIRFFRSLLRPILKLFFNPNPLISALHIQSELNAHNAATNATRENLDALNYELVHNLVLETTRLSIEVKNLKMRVESMSSRLDFDERRARALEGVVQYRPGAVPPLQPPPGGGREREREADQQGQERRSRRRRRRGRRPGQGQGMAHEGSGGGEHAGHAPGGGDRSEPESARGSFAPMTSSEHGGEGGLGETGPVPPKPPHDQGGEAGLVPPKPPYDQGGEAGLVPPKPPYDQGGEGG
jgi:hypothetical protein